MPPLKRLPLHSAFILRPKLIFPIIFLLAFIFLWVIYLTLAVKQAVVNKFVKTPATLTVLPTVTPSQASPTPTPAITHLVTSGYTLRVPILMYHYIGNNPNPADKSRSYLSVSPDNFEAQMNYLSSQGFTPISLDTLQAALDKKISLPPKSIILTFDDGYMDFYFNAYPILRKYSFHAIEFIPTGLMNQGYYLTWSQIKEMSSSGLIIFEAHSVHHYNLTSLSDEALTYELSVSKKTLENMLGVPINFLAYPYGISNERVRAAAQKAGYIGAASTWASSFQSTGTSYDMPRLRISGSTNLKTFVSKL